MSSSGKQELSDHTLLMVISTKLDNLIDKIEKMETRLENKVDIATFESRFESHEKYLKNLDDRIVEERQSRESIKNDFSYFKGQARMAGGIWGIVSSIIVGVLTHFFTK